MSKKKVRIVMVEGCPCEVVEDGIELGVVVQCAATDIQSHRKLCVAPDGSFVLPNPFGNYMVDPSQPDQDATEAHLRRLAREMNA